MLAIKPRSQSPRVAFCVHARHEKHDVPLDAKVQAVRESPLNQHAPRPSMKHGECLRVNQNQVHGPSKCDEEFMAQSFSLPFVPEEGVFDVGGCSLPNDNLLHRERPSISLSTRSHGIPVGPSRSSSSRRRSSSRRCDSVSGTCDGSAAKLSHTSSRRRSFSSGDKLFKFNAGSAMSELYDQMPKPSEQPAPRPLLDGYRTANPRAGPARVEPEVRRPVG